MSEFDYSTERCVHCDGHWRHYHPCPYLNCEFVQGKGYTCTEGGSVPHEKVQCEGCKEWWDEDSREAPHTSDYCVNNTVALCDDCRGEWNQ